MSEIVADVRGPPASFVSTRAKYGVDPNRIGVFGGSAGGSSRWCSGRRATPAIRRPPTRCSGNPIASRRSWRTFRRRIGSLAHRARRRRRGRPDGPGGDDVRGVVEGGRARVVHSNQGRGTRVRGRRSRRSRARLCRNDAVVRAASWERREVEPSRAQFDHQRHQRRRAAYKSHFELCRNCVRCPRNSPTNTDVYRFTSRRML
jgi:hypothetical protein